MKTTLFIIILAVSLCSCVTNSQEKIPTVDIGQPVYYKSDNGERFEAKYGSLSDGTLHFVKVKMPDGREYTLPQAISGSGARYTDDREIVWWEHQGTVQVDVRDLEGKWKTEYSGLKEIQKRN
jgi:membrane-bound inhibitor of C-type lysozyme